MYQPKVIKSGNYPSGVAKIRVQGSQLKILFSKKVNPKTGEPVNGEHAGKAFLVSKWPDYVDPSKIDGAIVYAKVKADGTELFQASPQDGVVSMVFTGFGAKEGEEPAPSAPKTDAFKNQYTTATAVFEITEGEPWMVGMPQFITIRPSLFVDDGEGNLTIKGLGNPKALHGPKLNEMLTNCGGWNDGVVPYTDNLLPLFQKRMLRERQIVKVSLQNGFVQNFWDTIQEDDFEDDFEEVADEQPFGEPEVTKSDLFDEDDDF